MQSEHRIPISRRCFNCASLAAVGGLLFAARPGNAAHMTCDYPALPVPKTFDLYHVGPAYFAEALENDPGAIFAFVRDRVAYEAYRGCLRGPRGTLLAMAGNSIDQTVLLAAMLKAADQTNVRFVRGRLSKKTAKAAIEWMWQNKGGSSAATISQPATPDVKEAMETLCVGVRRDYELIREHLQGNDLAQGNQAAPSMEELIDEARDHFWVRYDCEGQIVDLDPVFPPSASALVAVKGVRELQALPENLFHRVVIRVRLEENSGKERSTRTILRCALKACELSGADVVFGHMPENWNGPVSSLQSALASAVTDTGKIVPVLVFENGRTQKGKPFRPKPPARIDAASRGGFGVGGIRDLLSGTGRKAEEPVATAEWMEFEFSSPTADGRQRAGETVVREIFDHIGKARPASERQLDDGQLRYLFSKGVPEISKSVYGLFFTTGRLDGAHFKDLADRKTEISAGAVDVRRPMRRFATLVAAVSDDITQQAGRRNPHNKICFYPNSPRVFITEFRADDEKCRVSFDLRRDRVRTAVENGDRKTSFDAQIFHGVLDGTLERVLLQSALSRVQQPAAPFSTNLLFELANERNAATMLLQTEVGPLGNKLAGETCARLRDEIARRQLVIAPSRPLQIEGENRFAWWRVDPQTGHTVAVTDDGLHSTSTEYVVIEDEETGESHVFYQLTYHGQAHLRYAGSFAQGTEEFGMMLHNITDNAYSLIEIIA